MRPAGCGLRRSPGLAALWPHGLPAPPPLPARHRETVARARTTDRLTVARRRRLFTVFPCAESAGLCHATRAASFRSAAGVAGTTYAGCAGTLPRPVCFLPPVATLR